MKFRTDINGLRTYAVLAVIIFHFNKSWLPGGFAGVDVFFVISGYLMTSIIFRGLEKQSFSLWKFYSARIRRIIPALLVLIVILMIFGYLFLAPIPYANLAKHSGGSLLFISNIMYWKESGYFDAGALEKFLLHTWSLSVEWQFYMIYPIALLLLAKIFSIKTLKKILLIGTVLAFLFAVYASFKWSTASYFLLPSRIWEMLLGGIVFLYPLKLSDAKHKHSLEMIGLALIITSFFIISENTVWPGYMALIPTLGAFLLLQANNEKSLFTNNPLAQKIGLWSYSLYLYHWPILVINHKFALKLGAWSFLLITMLFSIASYYLIEIKKLKVSLVLAISTITLLSIFAVYKTSGAAFRVDARFDMTMQEFRQKYEGHLGMPNIDSAQFLNSSEDDFEYILLGNSHARHFYSYIIGNKKKVVSFALDGCISTPNYYLSYDAKRCEGLYEKMISFLNNYKNKKIIISNLWSAGKPVDRISKVNVTFNSEAITKELTLFFDDIKNSNHEIYLIGQIPSTPNPPFTCLSERSLPFNRIFYSQPCEKMQERVEIKNNRILKEISENEVSMHFINAEDALCSTTHCIVIDGSNPIYTDTNHLSVYGSEIVGGYIFKQIEKQQAE